MAAYASLEMEVIPIAEVIQPKRDTEMNSVPIPANKTDLHFWHHVTTIQPRPNPLEKMYGAYGWVDPEEIGYLRLNPTSSYGLGSLILVMNKSSRLMRLKNLIPDWPAPLPHESWCEFVAKVQ